MEYSARAPVYKTVLPLSLTLIMHSATKTITVVSLGGDCTVALNTRALKIREHAYPFDWSFSPLESICKALENDFEHYMSPDQLCIGEDNRSVVNSYGFSFVHDFPTINDPATLEEEQTHRWAPLRADWRNFIEPIGIKYQRRIDRFRNLMNSNEEIIFIRWGSKRFPLTDIKEIITLRDTIRKYAPHASFIIVALNDTSNGNCDYWKKDWQLDHIKTDSIQYAKMDEWVHVFTSLGIKIEQLNTTDYKHNRNVQLPREQTQQSDVAFLTVFLNYMRCIQETHQMTGNENVLY